MQMGVKAMRSDPDSYDVEDYPRIFLSCSSKASTKKSNCPSPIMDEMDTDVLTKELVGNSKEFRMEHNKHNLRIIGNANRIRITRNTGNIDVIGNNTRLKITSNSGQIKYTGNEGRICFGSESTQQSVEYIGVNGLLKVVNSMELCKCKSKTAKTNSGDVEVKPEDWRKWGYLFKEMTDWRRTDDTQNTNARTNQTSDKTYNKQFPCKAICHQKSDSRENTGPTHSHRNNKVNNSNDSSSSSSSSGSGAGSSANIVIHNSVNITIQC